MKKHTLKNKEILKVRLPLEKDYIKILEYLNIVGGETDKLLFGKDYFKGKEEKGIALLKKSREKDISLIGSINDNLVAFCQVIKKETGYILCISVKKNFWNLGIGSFIIGDILELCIEKNINKIELKVREDNLKAIYLYRGKGFYYKEIDEKYFYIDGKYYNQITMVWEKSNDF